MARGKRRGSAGFVYSDIKWSASLALKDPWLGSDTNESGSLFQTG